MSTALSKVADLVRRETGVELPGTQEAALLGAVNRVAPGLGPEDLLSGVSDPARHRSLLDKLIDEVTVQETSFLRDRAQFDGIPWRDVLEHAREAGSDVIRVWSVGCATGEEPYTLALLAAEAFAPEEAPVDVLGTDISRAALAAAGIGAYRERAIRLLGEPERRRYLTRQPDGTYLVGPGLRALVRFRRHNLAHDPVPPPGEALFDVIVCRNVLIYFGTPLAGRVIEALERSLRPRGQLVLGAADVLQQRAASPAVHAGKAGPERAGSRRLRRPLGHVPSPSGEQRLAPALAAAGQGDRQGARAAVASLLAADPLDADAHFIAGLLALEAGEPATAVAALRRALYADATFALAAFALGRAYDQLSDPAAARRAYARALRTLDPHDKRHERMLQQVDVDDVAEACRARLGGPI